ncbi:MAG TPA: glycosyltransferase [Gammaproteobacteria bacterium]|nr:glycosyltransferase [Gammaproteobacteria bacterium]
MVTFLLGAIILLWAVLALRTVRGMNRLPGLPAASLIPDADCPPVSILFSARDEAERLPPALASLLTQDYPHYQVIAVDDRSSHATGRILDESAAHYPHLNVIHLTELPPGWFGKPHGLQCAYEASSGAWLVFTDADVRFEPEVLRRAVALVLQYRWDHLTLLGVVDMVGFWEKVARVRPLSNVTFMIE